jgi:hypothetical protein
VTLLVKGNFTIGGNFNTTLSVEGENGVAGSTNVLGVGGQGGPGGFRGGDAAYQLVNFATLGGNGLGPNGGAGGTVNHNSGGDASPGLFASAADLLPLVGGSGGGGGASTSVATNCAGGGGGGGGGALLLAANGTVTINGIITADGGSFGFESNGSCASGGAGGSGGAVRVLASSVIGTGSMLARGGSSRSGVSGGAGKIRVEALTNTMGVNNTTPVAVRTPGPGPLTTLFNPSVAITAVAGQPISATPQGVFGTIDLVLQVPGLTAVDFRTSGVPSGTTVKVIVKPRIGAAPTTNTVAVTNCDGSGVCIGTTTFNLAAGSYFVEAQATFQTE